MIQVTIQLETLRCISQADITVDPNGTVRSGGGASEPYLWVAFFFFDFRAGKKTNSMLSGSSCRQLLPENVQAGSVIPIPLLLGFNKMVLDDSIDIELLKPIAGAIVVVLEENETSENLMVIGHRVFGEAITDEIKALGGAELTPEQRQAIADRVQARVFAAIEANAGILETFRTRDRVIGSMIKTFDYSLLKMLRDQGLPYAIQDRVRNERTLRLPDPFPRVTVVDEYEINGSIKVSTFVPPGDDPCKAQKDALAAAVAEIERIDGEILDKQSRIRLSPPAKQKELRAQIAALQSERRAVVTQRDAAIEALQQCQAHLPVLSGFLAAES